MFTKSLPLTVALALAAVATPALELKLSGPSEVTDVANLKLTAIVTNTGDETLKLLNDPRSLLDDFPAESFAIQHDVTGASPKYIGPLLKYVPSVAIEMNDPSFFTTLSPGESLNVTHDLSSMYDFSETGTGKYTFLPYNNFFYVDPVTSEAVTIYAQAADAHELAISGALIPTVSSYLGMQNVTSDAIFHGCTASRKSQLNAAAAAAQSYASSTSSYTNSHTRSTPRYVTWFGTYTASRHSTIATHFNRLRGNQYSSYSFDCSTCNRPGTFAYVFPDRFGQVYLCGAFWPAPVTGTDSKGGTLIHESSHFTRNAGTQDVVYGQQGCRSLARSNPNQAIRNADSHEYYAENNPHQN